MEGRVWDGGERGGRREGRMEGGRGGLEEAVSRAELVPSRRVLVFIYDGYSFSAFSCISCLARTFVRRCDVKGNGK